MASSWKGGLPMRIFSAVMHRRVPALALILLLCGSLGTTAAGSIESAYSRHDYERCKRISDDDPIMERRCEGHAGIPVTWVSEPDSSSVSFGTEGAVGGEFDKRFTFAVAGNVIEWRGPPVQGRVEPFAAIIRYQLCRAIGGPCAPELVVYRLNGKRSSCIAATVNGRRTDANAMAREVADSFARSFDCEKGKVRVVE
jgi:hypothetical protein